MMKTTLLGLGERKNPDIGDGKPKESIRGIKVSGRVCTNTWVLPRKRRSQGLDQEIDKKED